MTTRVTFSWENFDNVILAWLPFPQVFQVKIIDNLIGFNLCKRLTLNNHSEIKACNTAATINTTHQGTILPFCIPHLDPEHGAGRDGAGLVGGCTHVHSLVPGVDAVQTHPPVTDDLNPVRKTVSALTTPPDDRSWISPDLKQTNLNIEILNS